MLPQEQPADEMPKVVVEEIPLTEFDKDTNLREKIKFTGDDKEEIYIADLSLIDQAIILGLCTDVKNTNPRDGLTNEQMSAYIARIMAVDHNRNWMVHTRDYWSWRMRLLSLLRCAHYRLSLQAVRLWSIQKQRQRKPPTPQRGAPAAS